MEKIYSRFAPTELGAREQQLARWLQFLIDMPTSHDIRAAADWVRVADDCIARAGAVRPELVLAAILTDLADPERPDAWAVRRFAPSAEALRLVLGAGTESILGELAEFAVR